ncbi:peroxiredoxin [Streptomyces sp. GC420]|uniref:peroxiredoxin n=1 Tax=Streptomyces sp. GC420 TaxID=2697568 RepID=UPI001414DDCC|nr:peroxiredoxin [Streptomyces sp. GC420]NBM16433.1 redoxin domain-containing protein [Streptomyces sp. GC420]
MDVGDKVEDFELRDETGAPRRLGELLADGPVVLFFYPAAFTRGCTAEACHFRDLAAEFRAVGARPVGISTDPVERQAEFAEAYGLGYPLLSDPDGTVRELFGVKRGFVIVPTKRTTFVIGTDRTVLEVIRSEVRMSVHADRALAAVRAAAAS